MIIIVVIIINNFINIINQEVYLQSSFIIKPSIFILAIRNLLIVVVLYTDNLYAL